MYVIMKILIQQERIPVWYVPPAFLASGDYNVTYYLVPCSFWGKRVLSQREVLDPEGEGSDVGGMALSPLGQRSTCKNITFQQLHLRAVIKRGLLLRSDHESGEARVASGDTAWLWRAPGDPDGISRGQHSRGTARGHVCRTVWNPSRTKYIIITHNHHFCIVVSGLDTQCQIVD